MYFFDICREVQGDIGILFQFKHQPRTDTKEIESVLLHQYDRKLKLVKVGLLCKGDHPLIECLGFLFHRFIFESLYGFSFIAFEIGRRITEHPVFCIVGNECRIACSQLFQPWHQVLCTSVAVGRQCNNGRTVINTVRIEACKVNRLLQQRQALFVTDLGVEVAPGMQMAKRRSAYQTGCFFKEGNFRSRFGKEACSGTSCNTAADNGYFRLCLRHLFSFFCTNI